ncbi:MAG: tetratricopeptide repeat protein, partial [Polyangiales bacterium]
MILSSRIRRFTLVAATCVLAAASSVSQAAVDPEVQKHFDQGNSLYQDGRYADALLEYDAAYALSKNWKILYNRGQCLVMLKRDPEAIVVFQQYLDEGGAQIAPERKKQIEEDLPKLRARSATIRVENAPVGSTVYLDDRLLGPVMKPGSPGPTEMTIPIGSGEHFLRVEPPPGFNAPVFKRKVAVTGGMQAAVHVEFEAAPDTGPPPPVAPPPRPVDQPPPALPPRPPGGLTAPSLDVLAQVGVSVPSVDAVGVQNHALGSVEIAATYRATSFFELGLFADFAAGKPTLDQPTIDKSHVANAAYSYRILGVRGRLHLLRTKRIDGWFGVDFGAWQETWKFTGDEAFDFTASSPAFG